MQKLFKWNSCKIWDEDWNIWPSSITLCDIYRLILPKYLAGSHPHSAFRAVLPINPLLRFSRASICAHDDYGHPHDWSLSSKSTGRSDWHVAKGYGETRRALVRLNNRAHLCYWSYICGLDALCFEYSISRNVAVISYDWESSFPENDASDYASLVLLANAYRGRFLWKL